MPMYSATLSSGYRMDFNIIQSSQNVSGNYSTISYSLTITKAPGTGRYMSGTSYWSVLIDGQYREGNIGGYDFRNYDMLILTQGTMNIAHNSDGTKSVGGQAGWDDNNTYGNIGDGQIGPGGLITLSTIPRASDPSFSASAVDAGDSITINTNRASSSFTHTVKYTFGSSSGTIATGVANSVAWTPPLSLLTQIPNTTSGTCTITLDTYSGGTKIGTSSSNFTLRAGSEIVPTFTTVTNSEAVAEVSTEVGAYVKDKSKLNLAITGAAGVQGSTIKTYKITVAGQTINAASGVTPAVLASSGTVPIVGTITDSRGRTASKTVNVTVLNWAVPQIPAASFTVQRANVSGTPQPDGTYIRVQFLASVSSLMNGTQKNSLTYRVYSRLRGTTTWTSKLGPTTVPANGLSFNSFVTIGTYPIEQAFDVRVEVNDTFATSSIQGSVSTAAIFMHWADTGLGVGKFWEQGALDVAGDAYVSGGLRLPSGADVSLTSTTHPFQMGPTTGLNTAMDGNEIQARNNGAASPLNINVLGGNVLLGNASSDVQILGRLASTHYPWAMAAGAATITGFTAGTVKNVSITLPAGRFTQPPIVTLSIGTGNPNGQWGTAALPTTTTGLTIYGFRSDSVASLPVNWIAVQMSSSAAGG